MKRVFTLTAAALLLMGTIAMAGPGQCGKNCQSDCGMGKGMGQGMGQGMGMRGHGRMMQGDGFGRILMMAEELQLTDQQKEKIQAMMTSFKIERIDRQAEIKKARVRMADLRRNDKAAETEVMAAIDEIARLRADMQKMQYRHQQSIRSVLTDKQQDQLKTMRTQRMHRFWDDDDNEDEDGPASPRAPRGPRGDN